MDLPMDSALDKVRDMFVFQCYTALRFSDIKQLKHENIHHDPTNDTYSIDLLTEKDDDRINFPLPKRATAIYLKYKDRPYDISYCLKVENNFSGYFRKQFFKSSEAFIGAYIYVFR